MNTINHRGAEAQRYMLSDIRQGPSLQKGASDQPHLGGEQSVAEFSWVLLCVLSASVVKINLGEIGVLIFALCLSVAVPASAQTISAVVTSTGMGIGTTAPSTYLHVKGLNVSNRGQLTIEGSDYAQMSFYKDASTPTANFYQTQSTGDLAFLNRVSNANILFNFTGTSGNLYLNNGSGYPVTLSSGAPANSLVLTSSGNVGIGTNSPAYKLDLSGANLQFRIGTTSYDSYSVIRLNNAGNTAAFLGIDGAASSLGVGGSSLVIDMGSSKFHVTKQGSPKVTVDTSGNVGIGTTAPDAPLNINTPAYMMMHLSSGSAAGTRVDIDNPSSGTRYQLQTMGSLYPARSGNFEIQNYNTGHIPFIVTNTNNVLLSGDGGNVGIGTTSPNYKLEVAGQVRASSFVGDSNTYADFVFSPDYHLATLSEVEGEIHRLGHLPDVPSAAEAKEHGIDVVQMQVKLLQKVEELTLYVIDLKRENETLKQRLCAVEAK